MINTKIIHNIRFVIVNMNYITMKLINIVDNYIMCNIRLNSSPQNSTCLPISSLTLKSIYTILSIVTF